jgi:hypothetical protein
VTEHCVIITRHTEPKWFSFSDESLLFALCVFSDTHKVFFFILVPWTRWWPLVGLCKLFSCSPLILFNFEIAPMLITSLGWIDYSIQFEMNFHVLLQIFYPISSSLFIWENSKNDAILCWDTKSGPDWVYNNNILEYSVIFILQHTYTIYLCPCNRNPPQGKELYTLHNSQTQAIKKRYIYSLGAHMGLNTWKKTNDYIG